MNSEAIVRVWGNSYYSVWHSLSYRVFYDRPPQGNLRESAFET